MKLSYTKKTYNLRELEDLLFRRAKKSLRILNFKPKSPIYLKKETSLEFDIAHYFLKNIFSAFKIEISESKGLKPSSLDEQSNNFLDYFLKNKKKNDKLSFPNNILIEEMLLLKNKIKSKNKPRFKNSEFIIELKEKYPDVFFSLLNTKIFLEKNSSAKFNN